MGISDFYHYLTGIYNDIRSRMYLKRISSHHDSSRPIRVGFIVQMYEVWSKSEPVYRIMKSDKRFETTLLVVPPFDSVTGTVLTSYSENDPFLTGYTDELKHTITDHG